MISKATEIGIVLEPRGPIRQLVRQAKLAEGEGFEFIGITDGQMIWRDVSVALSATALATTSIRIGPWVTNPITRHPTVIANFICTLDEISGGRAFLGIGNGDDAVRTIGAKPSTMAALAEIVDVIRDLIDGEVVPQPVVDWKLSTGSEDRSIPIYWAGANPLSLEHGSRHADGLIISGFVDYGWLSGTIAHIRAVAPERDPELIFNSAVCVDEDGDRVREAVLPYVASGLRHKSAARLVDWSEDDVIRMQEAYDPYHHFLSTNDAAVALVPNHMIPKKSISGTPEECAELMAEVVKHGITKFSLMPMGNVEKVISLLGRRVRPLVESKMASGGSSVATGGTPSMRGQSGDT